MMVTKRHSILEFLEASPTVSDRSYGGGKGMRVPHPTQLIIT